MSTVLKICLAMLLIISSIYAQEERPRKGKQRKDALIQERDRSHSVREVVQSVGQLEEKEISEVDARKNMFNEGTVSGQLKTMYGIHSVDNHDNPYATAVGATLKYELAEYKGFNAGAAFSTTHDVNSLTADADKHNYYLSTLEGSYTELTEAYINYKYKDLNLRGGRQIVDTPLADSDDVRMISNTFEAYIATLEFNRWTFMAGNLKQWQGSDTWAQRDSEGWQSTGEDGAYFGGISLSKVLLDLNLWYYDFSKDTDADSSTGNIANQSVYLDASLHNKFQEDFFLHTNLQYLHQSESDSSTIEANVYGALVEFVAHDFGISVAYNKAEKQEGKGSFSGYGGGTLYTNMDNMIIDNITLDREVEAIVAGVTYAYDNFGFLYAYGDFNGKEDSSGQKEHVVEQNIGMEYAVSEALVLAAICVINDNKEDTGSNAYFVDEISGGSAAYGDFVNYRIWLTYNF